VIESCYCIGRWLQIGYSVAEFKVYTVAEFLTVLQAWNRFEREQRGKIYLDVDEALLSCGVGAGARGQGSSRDRGRAPPGLQMRSASRGSLPPGDPAKTPAVCPSSRAAATLQVAVDRGWPGAVAASE
jgi:hypothetical protein